MPPAEKVALISGGLSGIGTAIAWRSAVGGATVVAAAALFPALGESAYIIGQVLNVDGGWQASRRPAERVTP